MRIDSSDHGEEQQRRRPVIALSGASGYIGRNLLKELTADADVIALSRNGDERQDTDDVTWRSCDFYAADDAVKGLAGADYAVYLLHSMMPSAKLTQGTFQDMDVILATHFARAAQKNGIRQIVYLSGMIPPDTEKDELSRHLRSRLEVEEILGSFGVPVTTIRAGLIVGPQGSSFPILSKLVRRLPFMILPRWTRTRTHPIALSEVVEALLGSIGRTDLEGRIIDVGGPDVLTYAEMLDETAQLAGRKLRFLPFPLFTVHLSRLWVSLVTGTPKAMAYPLIESLIHPMVASNQHHVEGLSDGKIPFREAAEQALEEEREQEKKAKKKKKEESSTSSVADAAKRVARSDVRSVQRIILPPGKNAAWAGGYYVEWLSRFAGPVFRAEREGDISRLYLLGFRKPLLQLTYDAESSGPGYACYRISGGSFAKLSDVHSGRLEFVQIEGTRECVVAIHDYMPSLPWVVYKYSQAKLHLLVMWLYRRHLLRLKG
ncbi:NAD(P)H-binding protein [Paenibacillus daejeonensis]|uniref:NAD(P)H-binding protein n=1 Tax=Paenibacillus daejeonensis TaxID=135193 RepID=UPI00037A2C76|nr:NAD(P)H-binding protein [Paenibacillus daejeonensis]